MDRNFARSLALVLKSEGGFVNDARDPGGATNLGITLANFRRYIEPTGTVDDLKRLTKEQAATCYRKQYWDAISGDDLPDGVDYAVCDFAVNSGPGRAAKYLQAAVGMPQDGTIGPATIAAVKAKPAGVVIDTLCDARLAFLKRLPTWGAFGNGWAKRVESVRKDALKMTVQGSPPMAQQPVPPPAPPPAAPMREPQPLPAPSVSKPVVAAGAFALIAMALANWWHELTQFVSNLF